MAKIEYPKPAATDPQHLDDFKGSTSDQNRAKSDFISKFGYDAYEELVRRSRPGFKK